MISGVEKSSKMKVVGIIPARYHSTRLPGKPLRRLAGKILIQRVYENAARCRLLDDLLVATDDERIRDAVQEFGGKAVMTPADLPSGSDRCAFVAQTLEAEIIADIQGDEPFLDIGVLEQAIRLLRSDPEVNIVTAARTGITSEELADPNVVKVLLDKNRNALLFSRQNIPYIRDRSALTVHPARQHIGLYVFRNSYLQRFVGLPQTELERLEQLEQLRILENSEIIRVVETDQYSLGIDTEADLKQAERIIAAHEN